MKSRLTNRPTWISMASVELGAYGVRFVPCSVFGVRSFARPSPFCFISYGAILVKHSLRVFQLL